MTSHENTLRAVTQATYRNLRELDIPSTDVNFDAIHAAIKVAAAKLENKEGIEAAVASVMIGNAIERRTNQINAAGAEVVRSVFVVD